MSCQSKKALRGKFPRKLPSVAADNQIKTFHLDYYVDLGNGPIS